jgi:hypothetical protein
MRYSVHTAVTFLMTVVMFPALVAIALIWMPQTARAQDPAGAQEFQPTEMEKKLCEARRKWRAAEKEYARLDWRRSELSDEEWDRWKALRTEIHELERAWEAIWFGADGTPREAFSDLVYAPGRKDQYNCWCIGVGCDSSALHNLGMKLPARYFITLYMPEDDEYAAAQTIVFRGAKERYDFTRAQITGEATWETFYYDGPARNQTIKAVLWRVDNSVKKALSVQIGTTDDSGRFKLHLPVRAGAGVSRSFSRNIKRRIIGMYFPDDFTPPSSDQQQHALKELVEGLPDQRDLTKEGIGLVSAIYAAWKDSQLIKAGKIGTPNTDRWQKNHDAGRDDVNALNMLIDVATSPATASAQVVENVNGWYKQLTGKPLPGVSEMSAAQKADLKKYYNRIWDRMELTKFAAEKGRLPEPGEFGGLIK